MIQQDTEYAELKAEFEDYYTEKLEPVLQQNEKSRYRYLLFFAILLLLMLVFYPYMIFCVLHKGLFADNAYVGILLAISCLVVMALCGPMYVYKKKVKPQIMPELIKFFGDFNYGFEVGLDEAILQQSGLFAKYNNREKDDYFRGKYDGVGITIAEEKLRWLKRDYRDFEVKKKVFDGVCILLEMNKNFAGKTLVLKESGIFNALNKVEGLQNVKLEDLRFEKYFEVYSDDQIEARYLLTSAFMERILKLRDLYEGKSIQMSFYNNKLLLAIPTKQNMFEANSFFGSNLNRQKVNVVFEQFYTIFSIIKLLKLNQRIGM